MEYNRTIRLRDGRDCVLRNGTERDGRDALEEGSEWIETLGAIADSLDDARVDEICATGSGVEFARMIREAMFKKY